MFALLGSPRRIGVGVAALGAAMLLTGCAAGQKAATAEEKTVLDGTTARIGTCQLGQACINLNALSVAPPTTSTFYAKGSDAPLRVLIANSGQEDDRLTNITTDAAGATTFYISSVADTTSGSPCNAAESKAVDAQSETPKPEATQSPNASNETATGSAPASGSGTTTANKSTSAKSASAKSSSAKSSTPTPCATPAAPGKLSSIDVGAGERVSIGYGAEDSAIVLSGLTSDLFPARSITLTFTFAKAGTTTVAVPVHLIALASVPPSVDVKPKSE